ncbi:MAG: helix-turn-helix domain-containing protein [Rubellimicrobium sp.]|nr:helix-turn-helix domain-containing protein [Rubellimicrobium sp.]
MTDRTVPNSPFLCDTREAARLLGLSASHLEKLRFYRKPGPPFVRIGKAIRYPIDGLHDWAVSQAETHGD